MATLGWSWRDVCLPVGSWPRRRTLLRLPELDLPPQGLVLLLGDPGSGKSTLLRWLWTRWRERSTRARMVPERFAFPPGTRLQTLLAGISWPEGLPTAGLDLAQRVDGLSRGQRQLVALASLERVPVWLLDEPLLGLDLAQAHETAGWLQSLAQDRLIVAASHRWECFLPLDPYVLVLAEGGCAYQGSLAALVDQAEARLTIANAAGELQPPGIDLAAVKRFLALV
ncbi:MAG: ABC transporter ATP-binding protein [Verrucomicrobiota bacterium JB022]|nr:ABC transporter ATP-binding protein [Verrucomicrobiota bacterium JB022]